MSDLFGTDSAPMLEGSNSSNSTSNWSMFASNSQSNTSTTSASTTTHTREQLDRMVITNSLQTVVF